MKYRITSLFSILIFFGIATTKAQTPQTVSFSYTGAVQNWTVPCGVTQVTITVAGAAGGSTIDQMNFGNAAGGKGASFSGVCNVTAGDNLSLAIGGMATGLNVAICNQYYGAGGGGGTFVYDSNTLALLMVGAGGGGAASFTALKGGDGGIDILNNTTTNGAGHGAPGGTGGNGGNGGPANAAGGCGGAGWNSNGGNVAGAPPSYGGNDRVNLFTGGAGIQGYGHGGYGGGGGGGNSGAGGGGGYNGGGGGNTSNPDLIGGGGGGGSYLNGTLIDSARANNTGNGYVTITYVNSALIFVGPAITQNITCNGANNGSVYSYVCGGTPPYTYSWSNGQTTANISGLSAGTYTISVLDQLSNSASASITLSQPNALTVAPNATPSTLCAGNCSALQVIAAGGTPGYNYAWSNGATTSSVNVCPALTTTYTVGITDANGCHYDSSITVNVNALPAVTLTPSADSICFNMTQDSLIGSPMGGVFSGPGVSGSNFNPNIAGVGIHTILYTYTDGNGCSNTDSAKITVNPCILGIAQTPALDDQIKIYPSPFSQNINVNNGTSGTITITLFNMLGESIGSWQMDKGMNTISASNIASGVYTLQVKIKDGLLNKKLVKVN